MGENLSLGKFFANLAYKETTLCKCSQLQQAVSANINLFITK